MADTFSQRLSIVLREVGSLLPTDLKNSWGVVLNEELETIDRVIGEVCSPEQISTIRQKLAEARKIAAGNDSW